MTNKLLIYTAAFGLAFFQIALMSAPDTTRKSSGSVDLPTETKSREQNSTRQLTEGKIAPRLRGTEAIKVEVIGFTRHDPLPEYIPACEGCSAIRIVFSVTCIRPDGCRNLSVMDFYVTYDSDYPVLFYGDESPNPIFQGKNYAGIIYGAQKEFSETYLAAGETTIGELSFTAKPDASNFIFHYHQYGHDEGDIALKLTEGIE